MSFLSLIKLLNGLVVLALVLCLLLRFGPSMGLSPVFPPSPSFIHSPDLLLIVVFVLFGLGWLAEAFVLWTPLGSRTLRRMGDGASMLGGILFAIVLAFLQITS